MCCFSKVSLFFPCGPKSLLNFRLSSNTFIYKVVSYEKTLVYRSYEDGSADVSLSLPPPCLRHLCESCMNPTEMSTTSENRKNIGGDEYVLNSDS